MRLNVRSDNLAPLSATGCLFTHGAWCRSSFAHPPTPREARLRSLAPQTTPVGYIGEGRNAYYLFIFLKKKKNNLKKRKMSIPNH